MQQGFQEEISRRQALADKIQESFFDGTRSRSCCQSACGLTESAEGRPDLNAGDSPCDVGGQVESNNNELVRADRCSEEDVKTRLQELTSAMATVKHLNTLRGSRLNEALKLVRVTRT